jgi:hypothetical protein
MLAGTGMIKTAAHYVEEKTVVETSAGNFFKNQCVRVLLILCEQLLTLGEFLT